MLRIMLNHLYLVLLLGLYLVVSVTAVNRTDDAALFSSGVETILAKGNHPVTSAAPTIIKHASKPPEEHSKLAPASLGGGNISLDLTGHKVEVTKLELAKPLNHISAPSNNKVETGHSSSSNKLDSTKQAPHNVTITKVETHKPTTAAPVFAPVDKIASSVSKHEISNSSSSTSISDKVGEHGHTNETIHKFCDYIKPICDSVDKIQPKALFKIQTQFKQFVHLTAGKLSLCFLEHYSFDPNMKPISIANLKDLCSSKNLITETRGSYKAFSNCAASNWDPVVDKELDRIIEARLNCAKNHQHSKTNATGSTVLTNHDDEDDLSLISQVVSKVLEGDKNDSVVSKNSDIKYIDLSISTTHKPATVNSTIPSSKQVLKQHSSTTAKPETVKNLLNDPNTVVVFVDDSKPTTKSSTPDSPGKVKTPIANVSSSVTTPKPVVLHSTTKYDLPSNTKLTVETNKQAKSSSSSSSPDSSNKTTTSLGHKLLTGNSASSVSTSSKPIIVVASTTLAPSSSASTTKKVEIVVAKTTKSPTNKIEPITKAGISSSSTTIAPQPTVIAKSPSKALESIGELMLQQEKEKAEFESKLKAEREKVLKQLQKKQDEFEAQSAIKSLQTQREASAHHDTDNRLHQLEHERQMAIDPIGHSMKHQQYELGKQQRMLAGGK